MGLLDMFFDFFTSSDDGNNNKNELIKKYYEAYIKNFYARHLASFSEYEKNYREENGYFSSVTGISTVYKFNKEDYPIPPVPNGAIDLSVVEDEIEKTKTFMGIKDYEEDVFFENFYYYVCKHCNVSSKYTSYLFTLVEYERKWNRKYYDDWKNDDTLY